ncbi:DUF4240 domain-containing protein [Urechidicola croceus]|uniref:DUF4240 domain-containing protein n=1 Tax=Urechidicola croceus TaxID=1850246 RepID=A0A1D8PAM5_9FLAO|nr:DUF4240 domain-containing protein [Urechidicola croceus]AOW21607.1 hypothetical protein LPB138_13365 [Urechidicola croceus]
MKFTSIIIFTVIVLLIHYFKNKKLKEEDSKIDDKIDAHRRKELKKIIENRKERRIIEEYNEDDFWVIIDKFSDRSRENYKNHLGLIKDELNKCQPEKLIKIDNLLNRFYKDFLSHELTAAAFIIFGSSDIKGTYVLMNFLMTKGRVVFKSNCLNPNLIVGKNLDTVVGWTLSDIISEIYINKTKELIPIAKKVNINEIKGEVWTEDQLPSKFPQLWMNYA